MSSALDAEASVELALTSSKEEIDIIDIKIKISARVILPILAYMEITVQLVLGSSFLYVWSNISRFYIII
jgi:hypothetical protein